MRRLIFTTMLAVSATIAPLVQADAFSAFLPTPSPSIQPAAYGDLPTPGPRRRARQHRETKDSGPAQPRTEPQGETAEQHKAYLKRYGF